jgi:hypothetical protein
MRKIAYKNFNKKLVSEAQNNVDIVEKSSFKKNGKPSFFNYEQLPFEEHEA